MRRTAARLADGREIIYFDPDGAPARPEVHDPRDLPPVTTTSQLRHDPLLDEWVVMASHRQDRTFLPALADCPLCPSRDGRQTEIPSPDYAVVVFENRFPSLAGDHGRCEVVCFSSDHDASFATLTPERARLVVDVWADRTAVLSALPNVAQVFCFENRGREIGVTLSHPHGQIYAYPYVTPRTRQMLAAAGAHRERTGGDLFAEVLAAERTAGVRVVTTSRHWTAFVPEAARWPVEVHVYPHRKVGRITDLSPGERDDFVDVYLDVLRRFDALYDAPLPYVSGWHQAPAGDDLTYLHVELFSVKRAADKLKYLAGSESAMGAFVTDVLPEDVATTLREVAL